MSFQGLVTFKDVAVCFSQDQWSDLDPAQKEFYGEYVLEEDCGIVVSLCKKFQVFLGCLSTEVFLLLKVVGVLGLRTACATLLLAYPTSKIEG